MQVMFLNAYTSRLIFLLLYEEFELYCRSMTSGVVTSHRKELSFILLSLASYLTCHLPYINTLMCSFILIIFLTLSCENAKRKGSLLKIFLVIYHINWIFISLKTLFDFFCN